MTEATRPHDGKLKIFFGAALGVGKTFATFPHSAARR
jgi:K+-sensing histidine kinase KdpD